MAGEGHMLRYGSVQKNKLLVALKHNKRELQNERGAKANIDTSRTHLNYFLHGLGSAEDTYNYLMSKIALAGIYSIRKNAVLAIECIFSLPVNWSNESSKPFFEDCLLWTKANFEGELISFDIHLDESTPHAHALILPLHEGKLQGDAIKGGKSKIMNRQKGFYELIGVKYGFKSPVIQKISKATKLELARSVMLALTSDPVYKSKVFTWFRDAVFANPIGCAQLLNIPIQPTLKTQKHFVDIKRSRGRGTFQR